MFAYKNTSNVTKTFYGVTFQPGSIRVVPGYINHKKFVRVALPQEPPKKAVKSTKAADSLLKESVSQVIEEKKEE